MGLIHDSEPFRQAEILVDFVNRYVPLEGATGADVTQLDNPNAPERLRIAHPASDPPRAIAISMGPVSRTMGGLSKDQFASFSGRIFHIDPEALNGALKRVALERINTELGTDFTGIAGRSLTRNGNFPGDTLDSIGDMLAARDEFRKNGPAGALNRLLPTVLESGAYQEYVDAYAEYAFFRNQRLPGTLEGLDAAVDVLASAKARKQEAYTLLTGEGPSFGASAPSGLKQMVLDARAYDDVRKAILDRAHAEAGERIHARVMG